MREGQQMPNGPACGVALYGGKRQVVIKMDTDQFNEVHALATEKGTSLAEQLRLLIEWGLEAAKK